MSPRVASTPGRLWPSLLSVLLLAYSEPLIAPALIGAPLRWMGASPVLTNNVLLLLGFFLTAFCMYAVVVACSGDHQAGVLRAACWPLTRTR